jgi:hypothetical protein
MPEPAKRAARLPKIFQPFKSFFDSVKSDLFSFKEDTLDPSVTDAAKNVEQLLQQKSPETTEKMLAVQSQFREKLTGIKNAQARKADAAIIFSGVAIGTAGVFLGPAAMLAAYFVTMPMFVKYVSNFHKTVKDFRRLNQKINGQIASLPKAKKRPASLPDVEFKFKDNTPQGDIGAALKEIISLKNVFNVTADPKNNLIYTADVLPRAAAGELVSAIKSSPSIEYARIT